MSNKPHDHDEKIVEQAKRIGVFGDFAKVEHSNERCMWLWKNFVDGRPEYWAFDNPYPCHQNGDPMTLGEPCGYAIVKASIRGRTDVSDEQIMGAIQRTCSTEKVQRTASEIAATFGPTRGEATVRDLRHYAGRIKDADDRELVQHAADLLEIAFRTAATLREANALQSAVRHRPARAPDRRGHHRTGESPRGEGVGMITGLITRRAPMSRSIMGAVGRVIREQLREALFAPPVSQLKPEVVDVIGQINAVGIQGNELRFYTDRNYVVSVVINVERTIRG